MVKKKHPASLLNPEAMGGDIASGGFSFQEYVVLFQIPQWLADESFTMLLYEGLGDIEARFFKSSSPQYLNKELFEVKNHTITPTKFLQELRRFITIDESSPQTYREFILISPNISEKLRPIFNSLNRIRNVGKFYENDDDIIDSSYNDFVDIVLKIGATKQEALFLFNKVKYITLTSIQIEGEGPFFDQFAKSLPLYKNISMATLQEIYRSLRQFVQERRAAPMKRREIEDIIFNSSSLSSSRTITIHTSSDENEPIRKDVIHLQWAQFWGGESRSYPSSDIWSTHLVTELKTLQRWLKEHRGITQIVLTGQRRLSAAIAFGSVFSAVSQYTIDIHHRDQIWSSNDYNQTNTDHPNLKEYYIEGKGNHLVVSIGVVRQIDQEVRTALTQLNLEGMSQLHIHGPAVSSGAQANSFVTACKHAIVKTLTQNGSKQIELFFAGPAHIAVFLGHRFNAIAAIQCYEWIDINRYVPTCLLTGSG